MILVSPHCSKRLWQIETLAANDRPDYDPGCCLCPGNSRADGSINPDYAKCYAFANSYSALINDTPDGSYNKDNLPVQLQANVQRGITPEWATERLKSISR